MITCSDWSSAAYTAKVGSGTQFYSSSFLIPLEFLIELLNCIFCSRISSRFDTGKQSQICLAYITPRLFSKLHRLGQTQATSCTSMKTYRCKTYFCHSKPEGLKIYGAKSQEITRNQLLSVNNTKETAPPLVQPYAMYTESSNATSSL